jgi:hypothetical protein
LCRCKHAISTHRPGLLQLLPLLPLLLRTTRLQQQLLLVQLLLCSSARLRMVVSNAWRVPTPLRAAAWDWCRTLSLGEIEHHHQRRLWLYNPTQVERISFSSLLLSSILIELSEWFYISRQLPNHHPIRFCPS